MLVICDICEGFGVMGKHGECPGCDGVGMIGDISYSGADTQKVRPSIYTASKVKHAAKWRTLREAGVNVVSTWIDYPDRGLTEQEMIGLWLRCASEAAGADFVLLYAEPGEVFKGALLEAGCCLGRGGRVLQVGTCDSVSAGDNSDASFTRHPNWSRHGHLGEALKAAGNL